MRIVAIGAVILIHVPPFTEPWWEQTLWGELSWIINQSARFAVPFFFIMAGYFFRRALNDAAPMHVLRRYGKRIVIAFVSWSAVYALFGFVAYHNVFGDPALRARPIPHEPAAVMLELLFVGTRSHLFFLPALAAALAIVAAAHHLNRQSLLPPLSILLYGVGVLGGSYATTSCGFHMGFDPRNGPFFSTLMVVIGTLLFDRRVSNPWAGVGLFLVGGAVHLTEVRWLAIAHGIRPLSHNFVFATPLFGLGFAWIALALRHARVGSFLPQVGRCTLGVYLGHVLTIEIFLMLRSEPKTGPGEILAPLVVYLLTLGAVSQLAHIRRLRPMLI